MFVDLKAEFNSVDWQILRRSLEEKKGRMSVRLGERIMQIYEEMRSGGGRGWEEVLDGKGGQTRLSNAVQFVSGYRGLGKDEVEGVKIARKETEGIGIYG